MKLLGNKERFGIEYEFRSPPSGMDPSWNDWGCIYFWVNGKNLFAFKNSLPADTYHWYLYELMQWFCENLIFIMDEKDLPNGITGENIYKILDNFDEMHELYDEKSEEHAALHNIRLEWCERHSINEASGRSFLPDMMLQAVDNKIEIIWDNSVFYANKKTKLLYESGLEYVEKKDFFPVIVGFCQNVLAYCEAVDPLYKLKNSLKKSIEKYNFLLHES